ncbi:carboxy terminal-processing peptidase [Luteolibacter yonseiensis]|uniref:Carboxy terminal-processing peptidase n=1 Tax=Luteolibacter yonseiensis TaxID=1144680 RepID=A0A934V9F4_9BACT|nr:carboxy terminal-processing peptidase [Luteolibacter yonseiensis]MBK1814115.1 carboxy terminal-processing peptidase [Luteolibacter yonseiensis]
MNPLLRRSIVPVVSLSAALVTTSGAFNLFGDPEPLDAKATDAATTMLTSKILEQSQFAHQELDEKLAGRFLDRYLDTLDGNRMVFLQSDIDEFAKSRAKLADATRSDGDSSLAHTIFKRYLERLDERVAFISDMLKTGKFDFTGDETFNYDRKDAPHPADIAAAKAIWTQQLRYEYLQEKLAGKKEEQIQKTLGNRSSRIADTMRKFDDKAVLEIYLESLAQVYDPHSDYMGPEQTKSFETSMNLSLTGIGATLRSVDGYCKVAELVPGGPADRSGLIKPGDSIIGVSQKQGDEYTDLIDLPLPKAVEMIRGKKGTTVYLNIIPAKAADESVRKSISIVREEIKLEDQQAKARVMDLPSGDDQKQRIGIIDLPAFYAGEGTAKSGPTSCTADVARIINKLKQENVTGIILDLRQNGGGSLQEAIDLTGLFIPSGPVVQTRNMQGRTEVGKDTDDQVLYDGPLVVLTSRFSASASEIVAGALQDYGRAVVVGDTSTFGKGTVQTIVPLSRIMQSEGIVPGSDPGVLKVTISKFYRPSGKSTQLEGVKADIVIPSLTDMPEIGESDLKNPLPWDTIAAAKFTPANRVTASIDTLRSRSTERVAKDEDFTDLKSEIERYRKLRDEKSVSLNEDKRKQEKAVLKARVEELKKQRLARATPEPTTYEVTVKNSNKPGLTDLYKPKARPINLAADADEEEDAIDDSPAHDLVLKEAQNILLDYSNLLKGKTVAKQQ